MWILSPDKGKLIKAKHIWVNANKIYADDFEMAEYESDEEAKDILDNIANHITRATDNDIFFMMGVEESKYYNCPNDECDFIYEIPNNFIINEAIEFTCPICKTRVFLSEETPVEKPPSNHKHIGKPNIE